MFQVFYLLLFSCCLHILRIQGDNPTSIIPAYQGSDPGYIIAESTSGLGNRLRVLAAYMHIAEAKYDGAHLVFIWETNEACPGQFLSLFEPIEKVIFATNMSRYVLDKHAKINYENSFAVFPWIMRMNNIPRNRHGFPTWTEIEYNMHAKYYPVREIMFSALQFVNKHDICNASAVHIRETDLSAQMSPKKRTPLQHYVNFIEDTISNPAIENKNIFLLTDDPKIQSDLMTKYPNNILVFSPMTLLENQLPLLIRNTHDIPSGPIDPTKVPNDHRFTTIKQTLIEVIIAAHAKSFLPTTFSSLSELVTMFNKVGKKERGWCQ